jgi:hypothetical protein
VSAETVRAIETVYRMESPRLIGALVRADAVAIPHGVRLPLWFSIGPHGASLGFLGAPPSRRHGA